MKLVRSEFMHEYESYSFGYTLHAEIEGTDTLSKVYADGYLPESKVPRKENLFYMARSARLPLRDFIPTSENRRIFNKFDGLYVQKILSMEELRDGDVFQELFLRYFNERHGETVMTAERLSGILARDLPLRVSAYYQNDVLIASALEVVQDSFAHFWFSCFDPSLAKTSLGMWLMQDAARRAKNEEKEYLYIGTAYGKKAQYKMNLDCLEYWNGNLWESDIDSLKEKVATDSIRSI